MKPGGKSAPEVAPLALCGRRALVGVGSDVRIYDTASFANIGSFESHAGAVLHVGPADAKAGEQSAVSFAADGSLYQWSLEEGAASLSMSISGETVAAATASLDGASATALNRRHVEFTDSQGGSSHAAGDAVAVVAQRSGAAINVVVCSLTASGGRTLLGDAPRDLSILAISAPVLQCVACAGATGSSVRILHLGWAPGAKANVRTPTGAPVTAVAVHPFDPTVTVGDVTGRLTTFYLDASQPPASGGSFVSKVVHWHSHAVRTTQWAPDGSAVASGGEEAVLCLWNAARWDSRKLPRLPGPLAALTWAEDGGSCLVACAPGTLLVADVREMKVSAAVHAMDILKGQPCGGVVPAPAFGASCVAVTGQSGVLRVYDAHTRQYVRSLRTAPGQAHMSKVNTVPLPRLTTTVAAFSGDNQHLATVDSSDVALGRESEPETLRFWSVSGDSWAMNTVVTTPHQGGCGGVAFTGCARAVSVGADGGIKRWVCTGDHWQHGETRSLPASAADAATPDSQHKGCLCVSPDGSVAVASCGSGAGCFAVEPFSLLGELVQHMSPDPIEALTFTSSSQSTRPLIAGHTHSHVFLWDLPSRRLHWGVSLGSRVAGMCALPASAAARVPGGKAAGGAFVASVAGKGESGWLVLFGSDSAAPVDAAPLPGCTDSATGLSLVSDRHGGHVMVHADGSRNLVCVGADEMPPAFQALLRGPHQAASEPPAAVAEKKSNVRSVEDIVGRVEPARTTSAASTAASNSLDTFRTCGILESYYGAAAHSLPPPSTTLSPLLDALMTYD
eukprot:TRINITY_DN6348_c0_g5_i1.p1 TRINITY_DN6348_c0_g5~~TRINITY_DN6348_c0_g5_i1.p1  ORF type:complete len:790 (+),score=189.09 TRINITY_DN6348_c0_g5_i1:75-2444(+)